MEILLGQLVLAAGWISFAVVHTALAGDGAKARLPAQFQPYYRVTYNCIAALHLALVLWLEKEAFFGRVGFAWPQPVQWFLWGVIFLGAVVVLIALARYDLGAFSGLSEAQEAIRRTRKRDANDVEAAPPEAPEVEPLRTDGINRYVRHPLYTGLFLVAWGRVVDDQTLATAVWASLYLVIGARFEERRLVRLYGDDYTRYRAQVPAFFPWPGRRAEE